MYEVVRTSEEIDALRERVAKDVDSNVNRYWGQTYAQGIDEALAWLFGEQDECPYPEDDEEDK